MTRYRTLAGLLLLVLVASMANFAPANAIATPTAADLNQGTSERQAAAQCTLRGERMIEKYNNCTKLINTLEYRWNRGEMGNSRGYEFPEYIKDDIRRIVSVKVRSGKWSARDGRAVMRVLADEWWNDPWGAGRCMLNIGLLLPGVCLAPGDTGKYLRSIVADTERVRLLCGAAAFAGSLKGGGYWGAGLSGGGCFFAEFTNFVYS